MLHWCLITLSFMLLPLHSSVITIPSHIFYIQQSCTFFKENKQNIFIRAIIKHFILSILQNKMCTSNIWKQYIYQCVLLFLFEIWNNSSVVRNFILRCVTVNFREQCKEFCKNWTCNIYILTEMLCLLLLTIKKLSRFL